MASQLVNSESKYQSAYRDLQSGQNRPRVAWFERLRERAMDRFEELGLPSVNEEEWKYTNLAALAKVDLDPVVRSTPAEIKPEVLNPYTYPESANSQLVLVNGILQKELSSLESASQVVAMDLAAAVTSDSYGDLVREYLARGADYKESGLTALNTALITSGAFVLIPRDVKLEVPLHILCLSDSEGNEIATFPRILIVSEANSSATIIETYAGTTESQYFTNAVIEIVLKDGARLEHYRVQQESHRAFHIGTTAVDLGAHSSFDATAINTGGQLSRHNVNLVMNHEGAECWVDGLYIVGSGQHTDTHSNIDHREPHCTSHQLYKGILDGSSRAVFNGKIFVRHGAQKTDAMQTNKNLLLSPEARVDTKPQLEIFADDVKCAHGAAVGQIDEEELFYLETRGIHPCLGRNLLTYGFAEEVIGKIKIDSIKAQLDELVLNRLNTRLEA
jgi:Fe-S cluster assembly protein SufD